MLGLSKRLADCLQAIRELTDELGIAPTVEEIRVRMGLSSKGQVHDALKGLRERGRVEWLPHRARSIVVIKTPAEIRADALSAMSTEGLFVLIADARAELASRGEKVFP